jgi:hypothetical protein
MLGNCEGDIFYWPPSLLWFDAKSEGIAFQTGSEMSLAYTTLRFVNRQHDNLGDPGSMGSPGN